MTTTDQTFQPDDIVRRISTGELFTVVGMAYPTERLGGVPHVVVSNLRSSVDDFLPVDLFESVPAASLLNAFQNLVMNVRHLEDDYRFRNAIERCDSVGF